MTAIYNMPAWANNRSGDAAQLAAEANTPAAIRKMDLQSLFAAIIGAAAEGDRQAVAADLRPLLKESKTVDMVETAIKAGDLDSLNKILFMISGDFDPATLAAVGAMIAANTLTAGAKFWNEDDGEMPETFTAEWVTATLTDAGYVWNNYEWVRA